MVRSVVEVGLGHRYSFRTRSMLSEGESLSIFDIVLLLVHFATTS